MLKPSLYFHFSSESISRIYEFIFSLYDVNIFAIPDRSTIEKNKEASLNIHFFEYPFNSQAQQKYDEISESVNSAYIVLITKSEFLVETRMRFNLSEKLGICVFDAGTKNLLENLRLNYTLKSIFQARLSPYYKVKGDFLKKQETLQYDIFLKFADNKYSRIYNKDQLESKKLLEKYLEKGHDNWFVKEDDGYLLADNLFKELTSNVEKFKVSKKVSSALNIKSDNVFQKLSDLSLNDSVIKKATQVLNTSMIKIESSANLFNQVKKINQGNDFLAEHSLMLAYISSAVATEMELKDHYFKEKLVLASLIHDVSLSDNKLDFYSADGEITHFIKHHPINSVEFLQELPNVSPDVDKIIVQHHEKQDGDGYPRGLDYKSISELSALFIVSEDFVTRSYETNFTIVELNDIIRDLGHKYTKSHFRASYSALCRVISKSHNRLMAVSC